MTQVSADIERFLRVQHHKITQRFPQKIEGIYNELYADITNENIKEIFTVLHGNINSLFAFLNHKNNPGNGGHFNADPSRDYMDLIELFRVLQAHLNNSSLSFRLHPYYEEIVERCSSFMVKYGGSSIPSDFPLIDVIEHLPVFHMQEVTEVNRPQHVAKFPNKVIGRGSYATVSRYFDTSYNQPFVVKRAHGNLTEKELQRFKNEYTILSEMDSLHVIKVHNYNDEKNEYTMEFATCTLERFMNIKNGRMPMSERIKLILQLFRAFKYIHDKGILHRDISYQNILVQVYEDANIIKVSDFGLVKERESTLTSDGSSIKGILNDPALALVGFAKYEVRHEIYALSQVINFILTGRSSAGSIFDKNEAVRDFIVKGMNSDIEQRYSNIEEMERAFQGVKGELLSLDRMASVRQ